MIIIWNYLGEHFLWLNKDTEIHLYCDVDEHGSPELYLVAGDKEYVVASGDEILRGREKMLINTDDIQAYFSAVVRDVSDRFFTCTPRRVDLKMICDFVLKYEWWPKWRKEGRVTDDCRECASPVDVDFISQSML